MIGTDLLNALNATFETINMMKHTFSAILATVAFCTVASVEVVTISALAPIQTGIGITIIDI